MPEGGQVSEACRGVRIQPTSMRSWPLGLRPPTGRRPSRAGSQLSRVRQDVATDAQLRGKGLGAVPEGADAQVYYSASSIRIRSRRKPRPLLSIFVTAMRPIMAVEAT